MKAKTETYRRPKLFISKNLMANIKANKLFISILGNVFKQHPLDLLSKFIVQNLF